MDTEDRVPIKTSNSRKPVSTSSSTARKPIRTSTFYDYDTWIGRSAQKILQEVSRQGGWTKGWSKDSGGIPLWASRVRNFFNLLPVQLIRLNEEQAAIIRHGIPKPDWMARFNNVEAYHDEYQTVWLQTDHGGTIYHFPGNPSKIKAAYYSIYKDQSEMPIFKLVSNKDAAYGTSEVIINNRLLRANAIGKVHKPWPTKGKIETREIYAGSYNYGDYNWRGMSQHERLDIQPHSNDKGFYVRADLSKPLHERIFPELDQAGKIISKSDEHGYSTLADVERKTKEMQALMYSPT